MLTIRRYQPADLDTVWQLHKTALLAAGVFNGSGNKAWPPTDHDFPHCPL